MIQTRDDIVHAWNDTVQSVTSWFEGQPATGFNQGPKSKWTAGQHLEHLILSTKPLNLALRLPKIALKLKFGTSGRPSLTFDGMVDRYRGALSAGGVAAGPFVPDAVSPDQKAAIMDRFRNEGDRLATAIAKWDDESLDNLQLPHPLMGNLTVREMLYFTIYHTRYHLDVLARDYSA
ncbi:MAG: hypothetical protein AMXMBFR84_28430 [Candidatus Hydrogenedentota bacterium]